MESNFVTKIGWNKEWEECANETYESTSDSES
jgi:hypothetical protein